MTRPPRHRVRSLASVLFVAVPWAASGPARAQEAPAPEEPERVGPPASAEDPPPAPWPQWRGPHRDGRVGGLPWPDALDGERLRLLWRVEDLGPSYASPLVSAARVYTVSTEDGQEEVARAFERDSGELAWETRWEGAMEVPFFAARNGSWIRATPALDAGALYVAGMRETLVRLDAETGEVVWRVDFPERFGTPLPDFGCVSSPLVVGEHVYQQAGSSLVKLDKRTGATVWRGLVGEDMGSTFSSPVLAELGERPQLLVLSRTRLVGVAPADGSELWSAPVEAFRGMNVLTPVVREDGVFTSPYGGRGVLVRVAPGADGTLGAEPLWESRVQGYMCSPVVIGGRAWFFTRSNRLACVDLASGETPWISPPFDDEYWSLVAQGERILALSNHGVLRLLEADPGGRVELGSARVSEDETWAHLAVADGRLYVREQEALAAWAWE